jgi:hypothetical protein
MTRDIDALNDDGDYGFCVDCSVPLTASDVDELCRACNRERQLDETEFALDDSDED